MSGAGNVDAAVFERYMLELVQYAARKFPYAVQ